MNSQAREIYDRLKAEAIRLHPTDPILKITRKEALTVVKEWEINWLIKLGESGITTIFERKFRSGGYIQL